MDIFKTLILDTPDTLSNISGILPVSNGGTGADNAPDARVNLLPSYTGNANKVLSLNGGATDVEWTSNGAGDVVGPASSTDNAVVRYDGTTGKLVQNSGVAIDDSGNVGIGTTSPGSYGKLTVNDTAAKSVYIRSTSANFSGLLLENTNSATKWQIGVEGGTYNTAGKLNIGIDGVGSALMIDASRKVGIGTASPARALTVAATEAVASLMEGTSASGTFLDFGNSNYHAGSLARVGIDASGDMQVGAPGAGGDLQLLTASATRLTILNANGNVGIGTASPATELDVAGAITNTKYFAGGGGGANPGGLGGSKYVMDWFGGSHRSFSYGADASTNGAWAWNSQRSDGTNAVAAMSLDSTGLNSTAIGATTPSTGAFTSVDATTTFTSTGTSTMFRAKRTGQNADFRIYQGVNNTILDNANGDQIDFAIGGTARAFLSATGLNNAAIGATTPSTGAFTTLSVQTATNGGIVVNDGTVNGIIYGSTTLTNSLAIGTTSNHPLIFGTNNTFPQMTLATSGNVGIGTTSPAHKLTVSEASTDYAALINNSTSSGNGLKINAGNNSGDNVLALNDKDGNGLMRVLATGNVGIGTSSPSDLLELSSAADTTLKLTNTNTSVADAEITNSIIFQTNDASTGGTGETGYIKQVSEVSTGNQFGLAFGASNNPGPASEKMRISGLGDVFMHGTSINGTENDAGYSVGGLSFRVSRNTTANANQIVFYNPNGAVGAIKTSGSATTYNTSSDYRLKENVVPMSDALQRIGNLKPSRFNFIANDSVVVDGFLAHEVQEHVPEAISGEKDAMKDEEYEVTPAVLDDDGNEITPAVMDTRSVPEYQGIDQSKLVPLLVGAIQELTARIAALENN
jgi:hypothetical protein